jgi:hypothetical protein
VPSDFGNAQLVTFGDLTTIRQEGSQDLENLLTTLSGSSMSMKVRALILHRSSSESNLVRGDQQGKVEIV